MAAWNAHVAANGRPDRVPEDLYPFESRFAEVGGHRLHYLDEGAGPAFLFLHGNPTWSFLHRDVVRRLRSEFRCVAPDYPGFGLSRARPGFDLRPRGHADAVAALVDRLDLRDVVIFGQDWGGPIGFHVAGRRPERIAGFVIADTWAWPLDGDPHFERFARLIGGALGAWAIRHFNVFVNVLLPAGIRRRRLSWREMRAYRGPFRTREARVATHVFPRELLASRDFLAEVEAALPRLAHLPALIVWVERDFALRARERARFEAIFRRHETHVLPGAGHFVQEDAADEITEWIRAWRRRP